MFDLSPDVLYVLLIFGMFIVSRYLQRFRIPSAITCVALGVAFGLGLGALTDAPTVKVFAVLGIVALFLFAGMEIEFAELRKGAPILVQHLVLRTVLTAAATAVIHQVLSLDIRPSLLVALALLTPSTGFILDSLPALGVTAEERFWIKSKAIATEIVALVVLFVALQSSSAQKLALSTVALAAMVFLLPLVFKLFARAILPHAPKTEFAFLVIVALLCASMTKKLGVYYLVGAFIVGLTEQRLRKKLPALATENLVHAVELFGSFFIPFYFFSAGLSLRAEHFSLRALGLAALFLLFAVPLRVLIVGLHRRLALGEPMKKGMRVGTSLLPTLVFTMVLAEILRERFAAGPELIGALVVYALVNTLVPGFFLRLPLPEYDTPEVPDEAPPAQAEAPQGAVDGRA